MTNPVAIFRTQSRVKTEGGEYEPDGGAVWFWCPGCDIAHRVQVVHNGITPEGPVWTWNGDLVNVTVEPSILAYNTVHLCFPDERKKLHYIVCEDPDNCGETGHYISPEGPAHVQQCKNWGNCHSFLRNAEWEFLSDSAHKLAGQKVPMVPVPDWLVR